MEALTLSAVIKTKEPTDHMFICPERGSGSRFIIANTAIIKCLFHDVVNGVVDRNVSAAYSINQAMSSTSYATP